MHVDVSLTVKFLTTVSVNEFHCRYFKILDVSKFYLTKIKLQVLVYTCIIVYMNKKPV